MNPTLKAVVFWLLIVVAALMLWQFVRSSAEQKIPEISYSQFMSDAEAGQIAHVSIAGSRIQGQYRDGRPFRLLGPSNPSVYLDVLRSKSVEIWFKEAQGDNLPLQLLGTWAPLILLAVLWFYMIRRIQWRRTGPQGTTTSGP